VSDGCQGSFCVFLWDFVHACKGTYYNARMRVRWNTELAEWARGVVGDRSLRQAEIRTGISHMTVKSILEGRQPSAETLIRFAAAFDEDVAAALRLAGYEDIAEVWETGAAPPPAKPEPEEPEQAPTMAHYDTDDLTESQQLAIEALLRAFREERKEERRAG
jgi:hypothetical protein